MIPFAETARARRLSLLAIAAALSAGSTVAAAGYEITQLGLMDAEHTSADGTRYVILLPEHNPGRMNAAGNVIGSQMRYAGSAENGLSAWLHTGGQTLRLGFTDAAYTDSAGKQFSSAAQISDAGHVIGSSSHYASSGTHGWLYWAGSTVRLGLTDAEHTNRTTGAQVGAPWAVNALGQTIGYSFRYSSTGANIGQTAWVYSGGGTQRLGLQGTEFTGASGYLRSDAAQINDAGQVLGKTDRFSSSGSKNGESAWLYSGGVTLPLGLEGAAYTGLNGEYNSVANFFNPRGQVAGYTRRYLASGASGGYSAWLHTDGSLIPLGLTGAQYTRASDGYQSSTPYKMSNVGHVAGGTSRYAGGGGMHSWLYVDGSTTKIGLLDAEHTSAGGEQYSYVAAVNDLGQVAGGANHYAGARGRSAWLYADGQTRRIGLTDATHTGARGARDSYPLLLNGAGQVVGYSARYDGTKSRGVSGWFYDSRDGSTSELVFSTHSDGTANVWMTHLSEQGLVLGWYTLFNGTRNLGTRAFAWSKERGFVDLGTAVDGGLRAAGWSRTMSAYDSGSNDQIILGDGVLADGSVGFYLLKETQGALPTTGAPTSAGLEREVTALGASPETDAPMHMGAAGRPVLGISATSLHAHQALALGLQAAPAVAISAVRPGSAAQLAGLQVGDLVLAIDGASVVTAAAAFDAIAARKVGSKVDLRIHRQGQVFDIQAGTQASNR